MINIHAAPRLVAALLAISLFAAAQAAEPGGETLVNADIINMTKANTSPMVIVNRIYSASNSFDLSDQAFMQLKESGVADEVLNAMLAASKSGNIAASVGNALSTPPTGGSGASSPQSLSLPPLGSANTNMAPPSLSLPPLGGNDSSLGLPGQGTSSSFADMPGFGDLPAFGEMPGSSGAPSSPAGGFSPPPVMTPPPAPAATMQQVAAPPPPSFSPPPVAAAAPSQLPSIPQTTPLASPVAAPAATSLRPASPAPAAPVVSATPSAPAPTAQAARPAGSLDPIRFERELLALVHGAPDTQRTALAWIVANREQTLPVLRRTLELPKPEYQAAALRGLGAMNDKNSLGQIRDMLGHTSPLVRQYAAQALAEMNDVVAITAAEQNLNSEINPRDGLIRLVGYARLVRAAEALGTVLTDDLTALNRAAAAWSLSEIGPPGAVAWPALEKALLGDPDAMVRREAAAAVAAFHVAGSAKLLQAACRRDPEVRKIILAAMADYPETVEFLVSVINLGAEQIAPDEVETAARSLTKLTGQNFFLDGNRWQSWYNENKERLGQTTQNLSGVLATTPAQGRGAAGRTSFPDSGTPASTPGQVDLARMGIVVDPSEIPMAPEVDDRYGRRASGPVRAPNISALADYDPSAPLPEALSIADFADGAAAQTAPAAAAAEEVSGPATTFGAVAGGGKSAQEEPTPFSSQWGEGISLDLPSGSASGGGGGGGMWSSPASTPSAMPTQSVVGQPAGGGATSGFAGAADSGAGGSGGLRLALPPMGDDDLGGDGGMPSTMLGTVAAGGSVPAPAPTSIDSGLSDGLSVGEAMLFDSSPSDASFTPSDSGMSGMPDQAISAFDSYPGDVGTPAPVLGSESIPMDAILHDGFSGEVIVPRMGVDSSLPSSDFSGAPVGSYIPKSTPIPEPMQIPESAETTERVETLSFPGDTSTFGLGEPLFTESGPTADYEFDDAEPMAMPALPGSGASTPAAKDPLAAGLLGSMEQEDDEGEGEDYEYVDGGETFEPFEDASAGVPAPSETYSLPEETPTPSGEIESYADDSESLESMEWVRGVGFVKRAGSPATTSAPATTSSYYVEPPVVTAPGTATEVVQPSWSTPSGQEESDEYEVLEEGYLTAPAPGGGGSGGTADFFDAPSMPPVGEGIITSPSGPPLLGQEVILDVPEDTVQDPSGKPSRRLRKKR